MAKGKEQQGQSAAQTNGSSFTVTMTLDKTTKNAVRYAEDHATETEADRIGQVYMQKSAFAGQAEVPKQVRVTVEVIG